MKTLKLFYKQEIKNLSLELRKLKLEIKSLQRKGDYKASTLQSILHTDKNQARYIYLAYAFIRGKDLSKVESSAKTPHDPVKLKSMLELMDKKFASYLKKQEEVTND